MATEARTALKMLAAGALISLGAQSLEATVRAASAASFFDPLSTWCKRRSPALKTAFSFVKAADSKTD
eukprot:CAMPEP_0184457404 /NCGR_PEP_ID=MMETSP0740-20130409/29877_1 /TAXON_ID=385413 /ORGANISM="Thalassiosira miniscula, Strain CCMP1093" /LENGTH=67 /DNA_ID=CAMNT_0026829771 /DNA_START=33 /DNA_END=233 /DNA_ORIENTATION=-